MSPRARKRLGLADKPNPNKATLDAKLATPYGELLAKDKTIAQRYTATERSLMEFSADNAMRVHGAPLALSQFAEYLLRGSAVDYETSSTLNGFEHRKLLRYAWMFVREQLAADRWIDVLLRDRMLKIIDENTARLE